MAIMAKPLLPLLLLFLFALSAAASLSSQRQDPERRLQQCMQECRESQQGEQCLRQCEKEYRREIEKEGRGGGLGRDTMRNEDPLEECLRDCKGLKYRVSLEAICKDACHSKYGMNERNDVAQRRDPERRLEECKRQCRESQQREQCERQCEEEYRQEKEQEGRGGSSRGGEEFINTWNCLQTCVQDVHDPTRVFRGCMARCEDATLAEE